MMIQSATTTAPPICKPLLDQIPAELQARKQWVCWKLELRNGKWTKPPYNARTGGKAKPNDSDTWSTFEEACAAYQRGKPVYAGIGYVLSADDPYCVVDLDKCRDPVTGAIKESAQRIIDEFATYAEISPSETGIHIFCRAVLPAGGKNQNGVEIYDRGRYITFTGRRIGGR
jgi:putative DNA primase/helicase